MTSTLLIMTAKMNKKATATRGPKHTGSSRGSLFGGPIVGLGSSQSSGGSLIPRTGANEIKVMHDCYCVMAYFDNSRPDLSVLSLSR